MPVCVLRFLKIDNIMFSISFDIARSALHAYTRHTASSVIASRYKKTPSSQCAPCT